MRDLTMVPTAELPEGAQHVTFPVGEMPVFRARQRQGALYVVGSVRIVGGTVYTTIVPGQHRRPAPVHLPRVPGWVWAAVGVSGLVIGTGFLVAQAVSGMVGAVSAAGPAAGFLLVLGLVLLGVAALGRRRRSTYVEVTTVTRVRTKG